MLRLLFSQGCNERVVTIFKRLKLIFLVMVVIMVCSSQAMFSAAVSLPEPIGAFDLRDGSGEVATDKSSKKHNGLYSENSGWMDDFEGRFKGKILVPGMAVIDNKKNEYDMSKDFTWAGWAYISDMQYGGWSILCDNYDDETMTESTFKPSTWTILINTVGDLCVESQKSWGQKNQIVAKYDVAAEPKWRHYAVTFNRDTLTYRLYIDGVDQSYRTYINDKLANPPKVSQAVAPPTKDSRLRLAARDPNTHITKGRLTMVRMYNQTLSAAQIKQVMSDTDGSHDDVPVTSTPAATSNVASSAVSAASNTQSETASSAETASGDTASTEGTDTQSQPAQNSESENPTEEVSTKTTKEKLPLKNTIITGIIMLVLFCAGAAAIIYFTREPKKL